MISSSHAFLSSIKSSMSEIGSSASDVTVKSTVQRTKQSWTIWKGYIPTVLTVALSLYFITSLLLNGFIAPVIRRGFFCNDASIRYPHKPDTVDFKVLFFISLILPAIAIKICDTRINKIFQRHNSFQTPRESDYLATDEITLSSEGDLYTNEAEQLLAEHCDSRRAQKDLLVNEDSLDRRYLDSETNSYSNGQGEELERLTDVSLDSGNDCKDDGEVESEHESYSNCQLFVFGYTTTMFITGIGKIVVGRLRPHFWARCNPNIDCTSVSSLDSYVENFTCMNSQLRPRDLSYIATSWPSGHAAVMFYSMLFTMIYLNKAIPTLLVKTSHRLQNKFNVMLPYTIYAFMTSLAVFVSLTRVSDYHHHPTDVLSGSILGSIIAILLSNTKRSNILRMKQQNDRSAPYSEVIGSDNCIKCDS